MCESVATSVNLCVKMSKTYRQENVDFKEDTRTCSESRQSESEACSGIVSCHRSYSNTRTL